MLVTNHQFDLCRPYVLLSSLCVKMQTQSLTLIKFFHFPIISLFVF